MVIFKIGQKSMEYMTYIFRFNCMLYIYHQISLYILFNAHRHQDHQNFIIKTQLL